MFVACGSSLTVQEVAGTYDLTSIDGSDLPAPFFDGTITSGTLTLGIDSTVRNDVSITLEGVTTDEEGTLGHFPDSRVERYIDWPAERGGCTHNARSGRTFHRFRLHQTVTAPAGHRRYECRFPSPSLRSPALLRSQLHAVARTQVFPSLGSVHSWVSPGRFGE